MTIWIHLIRTGRHYYVPTIDVDCRDEAGWRHGNLGHHTLGKTFTISGKRSCVERVLLSLRRNTKFELLGESE